MFHLNWKVSALLNVTDNIYNGIFAHVYVKGKFGLIMKFVSE